MRVALSEFMVQRSRKTLYLKKRVERARRLYCAHAQKESPYLYKIYRLLLLYSIKNLLAKWQASEMWSQWQSS
jgi:hypothetical protein